MLFMRRKKQNKLSFAIISLSILLIIVLGFIVYGILFNKSYSANVIKEDNLVKFDLEEYHFPVIINQRGLNLVFFADQYSSWQDFDNDIDSLMSELRKIEPWSSYQFYNIYKINPKNAQGVCYLKVKDERHPVLRCQEEINDYLINLNLEKFKLVVLSRQDFESWANVVRLENSGIFFSISSLLEDDLEKKSFGLFFSHLMGHAFGLKDEEKYVIAQTGGAPHTPDGPNCAPDAATAERWWGDLTNEFEEVGYFKGCCGDENYIKPTESSIMNLNTGAPIVYNYGPVSEQYLKKILDYCFTLGGDNQLKKDIDFLKEYPEFKECLK